MQRDPVVGVIRVPSFAPTSSVQPTLAPEASELVKACRDAGAQRIDADRYETPQPVVADLSSPVRGPARTFRGVALNGSAPAAEAGSTAGSAKPHEVKATRALINKPTKMEERLTNIGIIHEFFRIRYAPAEYKAASIGASIDTLRDNVIAGIKAKPEMSDSEYHALLSSQFFQKLEDFHVSVRFSSTRADALPFMIVPAADGRFVVGHTARAARGPGAGLSQALAGIGFHRMLGDAAATTGLKKGDEVLSWNGRPIGEVVNEMREQLGMGTSETATLLVSRILTSRSGGAAHPSPSEKEVTVGVRGADGAERSVTVPWVSVPELLGIDEPAKWAQATVENTSDSLIEHMRAESNMYVPDRLSGVQQANAFGIGDRETFVPELGKVLMRTPPEFPFDAYICELPNGKKTGVVRIESFSVEDGPARAEAFAGLMKVMQENADCVVLNEVNNPGGSVMYLYALVSALAPRGMEVPQHHMSVTKQDATQAYKMLARLQAIKTEADVRRAFPPTLDGFPTSLAMVEGLKEHYKSMINEELAGKTVTSGLYVNGVKTIPPSSLAVYDGPLVVLTNGLCFSGADFLPAMLQDSGRAIVFGSQTAGAGGYVRGEQIENDLGVEGFQLTGSIADRSTRRAGEPADDPEVVERPIEGLGITPDVPYTMTVEDAQNGYQGYKSALVATVMKHIEEYSREEGRVVA